MRISPESVFLDSGCGKLLPQSNISTHAFSFSPMRIASLVPRKGPWPRVRLCTTHSFEVLLVWDLPQLGEKAFLCLGLQQLSTSATWKSISAYGPPSVKVYLFPGRVPSCERKSLIFHPLADAATWTHARFAVHGVCDAFRCVFSMSSQPGTRHSPEIAVVDATTVTKTCSVQ